MSDPTTAVFVDIETTGLHDDGGPGMGRILEIGMVAVSITDPALPQLGAFSWLVDPVLPDEDDDRGIEEYLEAKCEPYAYGMHQASGLLDDLANEHALPLDEVENQVHRFLDAHLAGDSPMIGGSGVAEFDRPWLKVHLPSVERRFHYRSLDVGAPRRFATLAGTPVPTSTNTAPHRALPDALAALDEARWWLATLARTAQPVAAAVHSSATDLGGSHVTFGAGNVAQR